VFYKEGLLVLNYIEKMFKIERYSSGNKKEFRQQLWGLGSFHTGILQF